MHDVAVVGAGLAGLQCARLLGRWGLDVVLLDRKKRVDERVHTTGIFVRRTLEDFDLPEDCLGPVVRHVEVVSPAGRSLRIASDEDEFRVGRMGRLYRTWLEDARAHGVEVQLQTDLTGVVPRDDGSVRLEVRRGVEPDHVDVRFVIGADGAVSRVAPGLGLPSNELDLVGVEDVLEGVPLVGPPRFEVHLDPVLAPGYLAWVVHDGEEVHVGVGGYPEGYRPTEALAAFRDRLDARGAWDLAAGHRAEHRGGRIPVGGVLDRLVTPHGLLTGDAAGAVSPLTAGGLDPCLRLSALAADVARRYVESGDPAELARYDGAAWRRRFGTRLALRRLLGLARWPWMAEAGAAALRTPPGRKLAEEVFFGHGSFPIERPPTSPDDARRPGP